MYINVEYYIFSLYNQCNIVFVYQDNLQAYIIILQLYDCNDCHMSLRKVLSKLYSSTKE